MFLYEGVDNINGYDDISNHYFPCYLVDVHLSQLHCDSQAIVTTVSHVGVTTAICPSYDCLSHCIDVFGAQ